MGFESLNTSLGIVSSIASIIGLILPATGWKARIVRVVYGLFIAVLAVFVVYYRSQVTELTNIKNQAENIIQTYQISGDSGIDEPYNAARGFILTGLTFLEKYKEHFPYAYTQAKIYCESAGVFDPPNAGNYVQRSERANNLIEGAQTIRKLLEGISAGGIN